MSQKNGKSDVLLNVSPKIKKALAKESKRLGRNVNDIATEAIAKEFKFKLEPARLKVSTTLPGRPDVLYLRMPDDLIRAVAIKAASNRVSRSSIYRGILAKRLSV